MTCINGACMRKGNERSTVGLSGRRGLPKDRACGRGLTQQAGQPSYDRIIGHNAIVHGIRIQQELDLATARDSLVFNHSSAGGARGQEPSPSVIVEVAATIADHITTFLP